MTIQRGFHIHEELERSLSIKAEFAQKIDGWSPFVGQVCRNDDSNVGGTGFLIAPGIFMTCSHVIPHPEIAKKSYVLFHTSFGKHRADFDPETFMINSISPGNQPISDCSHLDYTVIPLKQENLASEVINLLQATQSIFKRDLTDPTMKGLEKVSLIHYPAMHGKLKEKIIGYGSLKIDSRDALNLHHKISTETGSSGAPLFNEQGKL